MVQMQEIVENTDVIIRKIRDKFYEDTKYMTIEERCQYIYSQGRGLIQNWKNAQLSKHDSDESKSRDQVSCNDDAERLVCWMRDQVYEDTKT
ncbi:MAG: hypothetical protein LBP59_05990 [Planctomycetaceae bacterium]|jgi:hypothetical protein|nr:hypothetical protein [Planctomycetaceae bacterium]